NLEPWKGKPRYSNFIIENGNGAVKATEDRSGKVVTQGQSYTATHWKRDANGNVVKKKVTLKNSYKKKFISIFKVFSATTPASKIPTPGTLIVIYYDIYSNAQSVPQNTCCQPIPLEAHLTEQADRKARNMVAEGVRPRTAHDIFFKNTANMGLEIGEYNKYRRQFSRWRGAYLPGCVPGKIDTDFTFLYPPSLKKRWLLFQSDKITGFGSDLQLRMMAEAEALQLDSTYGTAPVGYKQ
uniref:Uncharacterized protein n=1 Tax=Panagrolaimus sp. ES5 TaxID=591445 RepID=A0AC34GIT0_9BILA